MKQIIAIAQFELLRLIKNRWLYAFAGIFASTSFILLFVSARLNGGIETGFNRFSASVINFIIIFVPLISLLLSSQSVAGDNNDNLVSLIKTFPVKPWRYVLGKYAGLLAALSGSVIVGFGAAFLPYSAVERNVKIHSLAILGVLGFFLLLVFVSWGVFIGSRTKSRLTATIAGLIVWVFLVFIYELIIWFALPEIAFQFQKPTLIVLLILNPVELYRICSVFLQGQGAIYGPDFFYWQENFNTFAGYAGVIVLSVIYLSVPLVLAAISIKKGRI